MTGSPKVVIGLDLGTTGIRAIAFSTSGHIVASSYEPTQLYYPRPGWVEQDPMAIVAAAKKVLEQTIQTVGEKQVCSIGITNQRETTIIWNKKTGTPVYPAIVWQDRRTADTCDTMRQTHEASIQHKTGLHLDPYFSATKISWILNKVPSSEDLLFGTVDTWVLWNITKERVHVTDTSNASRTMLFDIHTLTYDDDLLQLFKIPGSIMPSVQASDGYFGTLNITSTPIPIHAVLGDQQASYFAHSLWDDTCVKNTYGTGLFIVAGTGQTIVDADRLISTVAGSRQSTRPTSDSAHYAIEGSVFVGGSLIQWLRDELKLVSSAEASEAMATSVNDTNGVMVVPALAGLGAPHWDAAARGTILGLTRGTTNAHIVRAALESLAFQTKDVIDHMIDLAKNEGSLANIDTLFVDGGASQNNFLMQFQADILGIPVERPVILDTTSFGVAGLAGISSGVWTSDEFKSIKKIDARFEPRQSCDWQDTHMNRWKKAVARSLDWAT